MQVFVITALASMLSFSLASYGNGFDAVAEAIWELYAADPPLAPQGLRLAWHSAGTYIAETGEHGSNGGHIRFDSVLFTDSNAGLDIVEKALEPLMDRFEGLTYADLFMLAGNVAIEYTQGPSVPFCGGRVDMDEASAPPDGLLPPAEHPDDDPTNFQLDNIAQTSYTNFFQRMGFTEREMVALMASHSIGRMWEQNSGYIGTWDTTEFILDRMFFTALVDQEPWNCFRLPNNMSQFGWSGVAAAPDCSDAVPDLAFNMNPFDMSLKMYPAYAEVSREYALDEELMLQEFGSAWYKMTMLGVTCDDSLEIIDLSIVPIFDALDIFNLGYAGVAQMSVVLFVLVLCIAFMVSCLCLTGLDARCKIAAHPTGHRALRVSQAGGYDAF